MTISVGAWYIVVNILFTVIWFLIPICINYYRQKYLLPYRMIMWPFNKKFFANLYGEPPIIIGVLILIGTVAGASICLLYILFTIVRKITVAIAFSKEEKVQIAVGALKAKEKKN